MAKAKCKR
ncbi:hypothetical protein Zm00014a_009387 [Zea mays]|uniref:Uncharacterized protein n=1 Tax=Zea mays TaxID=4577 RepID=A0A3L6G0G7_MAIZE|nr:hypothetical protein Zm00014a_009387 [Zea mays]